MEIKRTVQALITNIRKWLETENGQQFKLALHRGWARFSWFFSVNWYVERVVVYLILCVVFAVLTFWLVPSFMGMDFSVYRFFSGSK